MAPIGNFQKQQEPAGLRHAFNDQNPRHNWLSGEMALEIAFVDGNAFQSHNTLQPLNFKNFIHHQEWRAVRQNFLNANAVKNHLISSSRNYMRKTPRRKRASPEQVSCVQVMSLIAVVFSQRCRQYYLNVATTADQLTLDPRLNVAVEDPVDVTN